MDPRRVPTIFHFSRGSHRRSHVAFNHLTIMNKDAWLRRCVGSGEPTRGPSVFAQARASMPGNSNKLSRSGTPTRSGTPLSDASPDDGWVYVRARDAEAVHRMFAQILHFVRDVELRAVASVAPDDDGTRVLSDPLETCPEPSENAEYYDQVRILCPCEHVDSHRFSALHHYRPSRTVSCTVNMLYLRCLNRTCSSCLPMLANGTASAPKVTAK